MRLVDWLITYSRVRQKNKKDRSGVYLGEILECAEFCCLLFSSVDSVRVASDVLQDFNESATSWLHAVFIKCGYVRRILLLTMFVRASISQAWLQAFGVKTPSPVYKQFGARHNAL